MSFVSCLFKPPGLFTRPKVLKTLLFSKLILLAQCALADQQSAQRYHSIELLASVADVTAEHYDPSGAVILSYRYTPGLLYITAGGYGASAFNSKGDSNASIELGGLYAAIGTSFDVGPLFLEGDLGLANTHARAYVENEQIGESDDRGLTAAMALGKRLNSRAAIKAGVRYIDDASGESLYLVHAGARWSF